MTLEDFARHGMALLMASSIKSLLLLAATGLALLCLRRSSAAVRHSVLLLSLACLVCLPIFSVALPGWRVSVWPKTVDVIAPPASISINAPATDAPGAAQTPSSPSSSVVAPSIAAAPFAAPTRRAHFPFSWPLLGIGLWALGVVLVLVPVLAGLAYVQRIGRISTAVESSAVNDLAGQLRRQLGLRRVVSLRQGVGSDLAVMPMTWGWRHPVVLLPSDAADWTAERQRVVLLHEFAHIRRSDWLWQMLAHLTCALYWFHPGVWLISRQLRIESERACDDQVLAAGVPATEYATHLVDVARSISRTRRLLKTALPMAGTSQVGGRVMAILQIKRIRKMVTRKNFLIAASLAVGICVPLATLRPIAQAQAPVKGVDHAAKTDPAAVKVLTQMAATYKALKTYSGTEVADGSGALGMPYQLELAFARPSKLAVTYTRTFSAQQTIKHHFILDGKAIYETSSDDAPGRYARITQPPTSYSLWEDALIMRCDVKFPITMYLLEDSDRYMKALGNDPHTIISFGPRGVLDGVAVDTIILASHDPDRNDMSTMQIGYDDHLLRKVTQIMGPQQGQGRMTTTQIFTNVRANPALPASTFVFTPPSGSVAVDIDPGGAHADPAAVALMTKMYAASAALKSFSCTRETTWETMRAGKLHVAPTGHATFAIQKPNQVAETRTGPTGSTTVVSDGRNLYVTTTESARMPTLAIPGRYLKLPVRKDDWNTRISLSRFGDLPLFGIESFDFMPNVILGAVTMPADLYDWKLGKPGVINGEPVDTVTLREDDGASKNYLLLTLSISRRDHLLRQVSEAGDRDNPLSRNVETYTHIKINPVLPPSLFVFKPSPGSIPVALASDLYAKR